MSLRYNGTIAGELYYGRSRAIKAYCGENLVHDKSKDPFWDSPERYGTEIGGYSELCLLNGCMYLAPSMTQVMPEFSDFTDLLLRANGDLYVITDHDSWTFTKIAENIKSAIVAGSYGLAVTRSDEVLLFVENDSGAMAPAELVGVIEGEHPVLISRDIFRTTAGAYRVDPATREVFKVDTQTYRLPVRAQYEPEYSNTSNARQYFIYQGVLHWYRPRWGAAEDWNVGGSLPLQYNENNKLIKWKSVSGYTAYQRKAALAINTEGDLYRIKADGSVFRQVNSSEYKWDAVVPDGDYFFGIQNGRLMDQYNQIGEKTNWRFLRSSVFSGCSFAMDSENDLYFVNMHNPKGEELTYLGRKNDA